MYTTEKIILSKSERKDITIISYNIEAPLYLPEFSGHTHKNQTNLNENFKHQIRKTV